MIIKEDKFSSYEKISLTKILHKTEPDRMTTAKKVQVWDMVRCRKRVCTVILKLLQDCVNGYLCVCCNIKSPLRLHTHYINNHQKMAREINYKDLSVLQLTSSKLKE